MISRSRTHRDSMPSCFVVIIAVALAGTTPAAQPAMTPMTISAPHEALTFFEGSWTIEERPPAHGLVETCAWLPAGRRHMVCRSTWRVATGEREGWSIFSYRASDSTYLYYGLRAGGTVDPMHGRKLADGWEFISESGTGSSRERARVTITQLSAHRFRLVAATAVGGGSWTDVSVEHYVPAARRP